MGLNLMRMNHRWILLSLLVVGLNSCDGIKAKLEGLIKSSLPEVKPVTGGTETNAVGVAQDGESVRQLSEAGFEAFVATSGHLVMVDFYADWCGPCRELGPVLDALVSEYGGKVLLGKVNVDQNRNLAGQKGVRSIPDVRFYKNGKEVDRFMGAIPANMIREKIDKHLVGLSAPPPPVEAPIQEVAKKPEAPVVAPDPATPRPPEQPKPLTMPMSKDWMPPGIKRR